MIVLLLFLGGLAEPAAIPPPTPPPAAKAAPAPAQPAKHRIICREETPTGTRFAKRVCVDQDEADYRSERQREIFRDIQSGPKSKVCSPNTSCGF